MCLEKKCLQIGAGAIAFALFLRLCASGLPAAVKAAISGPEAMAAILYLETGRVIRPVKSEAPNQSAQDAVMQ